MDLSSDHSGKHQIFRPISDKRDPAAEKKVIDDFVASRLAVYKSNTPDMLPATSMEEDTNTDHPSHAPVAQQEHASPAHHSHPSLKGVTGITPQTRYLLVVRTGVTQCDDILAFLNTRFSMQDNKRFLVKQVDEVRAHLSWLRGIPTLVCLEDKRIYEGSAVQQLLEYLLTQIPKEIASTPASGEGDYATTHRPGSNTRHSIHNRCWRQWSVPGNFFVKIVREKIRDNAKQKSENVIIGKSRSPQMHFLVYRVGTHTYRWWYTMFVIPAVDIHI